MPGMPGGGAHMHAAVAAAGSESASKPGLGGSYKGHALAGEAPHVQSNTCALEPPQPARPRGWAPLPRCARRQPTIQGWR